jgi:hypothetical protein
MNRIVPYLFVGSKDDFINTSFDFIVNCTVNIPFPKYDTYVKLRIPIEEDIKDITKFVEMIIYTNVLEKIYKFICSKQNVFVYSNTGTNRSCVLISCFLIKYMHMTPNQAIQYICKNIKNAFLLENENNCILDTIFLYYDYLQILKKKLTQKIDQNKK